VEELCCWEVIGGWVVVLMLDRCDVLVRDAVCIGVFLISVLVGSVGVEAVNGDSGGSPAGVKV
jgi:hypothetical protein